MADMSFMFMHVNVLGENLQTVRENTEILIKTSNDISLEANSEKTKSRPLLYHLFPNV